MPEFTIQCGPLRLRGGDITYLIGVCWIDKPISVALVVDSTHIILKYHLDKHLPTFLNMLKYYIHLVAKTI